MLGFYGLKHDFHDVTMLMDEPPLDELLKGTFDSPARSKDKGKKVSNNNESFLSSVRKACSIIQFPKPVQSQNMEMDYSSNKKMSISQFSPVCALENVANEDKEQSSSTDTSSCQKVSTEWFQVYISFCFGKIKFEFIGLLMKAAPSYLISLITKSNLLLVLGLV